MMNLFNLLAVDDIWGEVVAVSIGVIIMVGSAVGKALKKKDETNASSLSSNPSQRADLDELAARRRAELIAEAQRRRLHRQQQGRPAPPAQQQSPQQRPLTMADRLRQARQQALEQANARAQQRRQQIEAHRPTQQQPQRSRHHAQPTQHRPQQAQQPQRQPQRPPVRPAAARPPQRQQMPPQARSQPVPRQAQPAAAHYEKEHDDVHRLVRDGKVAPPVTRRAALSHHNLRQAIIWKEILDKPLALRDLEP